MCIRDLDKPFDLSQVEIFLLPQNNYSPPQGQKKLKNNNFTTFTKVQSYWASLCKDFVVLG